MVGLTLPDTPGLICRAMWSVSVYSISAAVPYLLKVRSTVLITCHITSIVYVALDWEDWTSLSLTVVNYFVAAGRSGSLQAVQLFHHANVSFTLFNVTLVSLALVDIWVARQAIRKCTTRKVSGPPTGLLRFMRCSRLRND